jgi:predicted dehydrogenase
MLKSCVRVAEVKEILTKEIAEKYGVNSITDYERLLKSKPKFKIVAITTNPHLEVSEDSLKKVGHISLKRPYNSHNN